MKYSDIELIILTAGKGSRLYPLTFGFPKCLLSVDQKPEIFNMIIPMIKQGLKDITFVVNVENKKLLETFINYNLKNANINVNYIIQENFNGPAGALQLARKKINKPLMILLGDTICEIPFNLDTSWIGVKKVDKEKERLCMVEYKDNKEIIQFFDKPQKPVPTDYAAIGIYYLKNYKLLKKILTKKLKKIQNEYQLSSVFEEYMKKEKMYIEEFKIWKDIGTLNSYKDVINNNIYDDYLTLMEYFCYYPLGEYSTKTIFSGLVNKIINTFNNDKIIENKSKKDIIEILIDKVYFQLEKGNIKKLLSKEEIIVNENKLFGIKKCLEKLKDEMDSIYKSSSDFASAINKDICFANILFSPRSQIFKLTNSKENNYTNTICGDIRYNIAKLRYSYHGRYDEIVNDLFEVDEKEAIINYNFYKDINYNIYDEIINNKNYNIDDIELIEGLILISALPLHNNYPKRQIVILAKGLECLNNQINRRTL